MDGRQPLRVALLGCGVVGSEVARLVTTHADDLAARIGRPLELVGIAVRRPGRTRGDLPVDPSLFTTDAESLVARADVDVVVEVIGGIEPARGLILSALENGASVVTANKALLAEDGSTLFEAAEKHGGDLYYEAAVAGAIPLLRPLRESLAGDRVRRVLGIVNGTTNFILTRMTESGAGFADALEEAQALGYAEADPTADVEGARAMGCVVKLLAIAEVSGDGRSVGVRAHPAMIPLTHPLASVREAFNAVFVECEAAGELMFYGRGAGGAPTASAVLGDVVAVARHKVSGGRGPGESAYADLRVRPIGETLTRYHVSLDVADRSGVLARVATAFAEHEVSIETVRQEKHGSDDAVLVIVTHEATDAALSATVESLRGLDVVRRVLSVMRVEGQG